MKYTLTVSPTADTAKSLLDALEFLIGTDRENPGFIPLEAAVKISKIYPNDEHKFDGWIAFDWEDDQ